MNDTYLKSLFQAAAISHLTKHGIIGRITYDVETTDLGRYFTSILEFAGIVSDVTGNILDATEIKFRLPDDVMVSPIAALVGQFFPDELYSDPARNPVHIAVGKMVEFLRTPHKKLWDSLWDQRKFVNHGQKSDDDPGDEVRVLRVPQESGEPLEFHLHDGGKNISWRHDDMRVLDGSNFYRDEDGTRWKKIPTPFMTQGYNNIRADDPWIWMAAFMAGHRDIFLNHVKKYHRSRIDVLTIAKLADLLETDGENGFHAGEMIDPATREPVKSYRLSKVMEANTHRANAMRGLLQGILMPDRSEYEKKLAHGSLYDTLATLVLLEYIRSKNPNLVRLVEQNADYETAKNFLLKGDGEFEPHPIRGFMRGRQLYTGLCIGTVEQIEEKREAVMIRTDTDALLKNQTYNHKHLVDMSIDELAEMMKKQKGQPEALFETVSLRKTMPVVTTDMVRRKIGGNPDRDEENRRFILENPEFNTRIIAAHIKAFPPMPGAAKIASPQAQEEIFTQMGELKLIDIDFGNGQTAPIPKDVHMHAEDALQKARTIDATLRKLTEPDPIEWKSDLPTLRTFNKKIAKVKQDLKRILPLGQRISLPKPDGFFEPKQPRGHKQPLELSTETLAEYNKAAVDYLWKLRATFIDKFNDFTTNYKVLDIDDHEVSFIDLYKMADQDRADRFASGEYQVKFEQLHYSGEIIAGLFQSGDRMDRLPNRSEWETFLAARKALRINGPPNEDPDDHRWMSAPKALKIIERIRRDVAKGVDLRAAYPESGLWESFVSMGDKAEPLLQAWEDFHRQQLRDNPFTPDYMRRMGYDPETKLPIEPIKYPVTARDKIFIVDIPDRMLEKPLSHPRLGANLLLIDKDNDPELEQDIEAGIRILVRGQQADGVYLAAKAVVIPDFDCNDPYFTELIQRARKLYEDSGVAYPGNENLVCLKSEAVVPLANWRPINRFFQTIKIPQTVFEAILSPVLGMQEKQQQGLVIKHYGYTPVPGPARVQAITTASDRSQKETGWEVPVMVSAVETVTLEEFKKKSASYDPEFFGFGSHRTMISRLSHMFADKDPNVSPEHLIHFVKIDKADKRKRTYSKNERPVAVYDSSEKTRKGTNPLRQMSRPKIPIVPIPNGVL